MAVNMARRQHSNTAFENDGNFLVCARTNENPKKGSQGALCTHIHAWWLDSNQGDPGKEPAI